jgi:hypothetical protein
MRSLSILAVVFVAVGVFADPLITSVTPNAGPVAGGTTVVIRGTGFSNNCIICSPPFGGPAVFFGGTAAASVQFFDSTRLEAVTPPHLPAAVALTVSQLDGSAPVTLPDAFTFTGDPNTAFEPILFPIFMPPVHGAFGSEFRTDARVWNKGPEQRLFLYGVDVRCLQMNPVANPVTYPITIDFEGIETNLITDCSQSTGRVLWVRKGTSGSLAANLRVADLSREATSHGTEIPVVRQANFTTQKIALLGVPVDPNFRSTLRIYSLVPTTDPVNISINGLGRQIFLTPGRDIFEPAFAAVNDLVLSGLPSDQFTIRVVILPTTVPLWAFISVTNNTTQQITTITPN